jgi:D-3-phosphoglycerate dehydrogenase / 2-oxoglutarate reductase
MMTAGPRAGSTERALCAGDAFIRPDSLAVAASTALNAETVLHASRWPDEPFRAVDGVKEAAGDPAEIAALAAEVTVVLTHLAPVTAQVFAAARRLRVVGVTRGGPVNVDLAAATEHAVPVIYLPGRNLGAVAEFVLGVVIALTRNIAVASHELSAGTWDARYFRYEQTGPELRACTVGLVGLGAIGRRVAHLLRGFGAEVLAFDPFTDEEAAASVGATLVDLPHLLTHSDIISVHARLTEETRGMFGTDTFAGMKPGARFVNTARGELVDRAALLAALESGHLAGAALDVFDPEPPEPGDPLLRRPDVVVTPHIAGASRQVAEESVQRVTMEVARYLTTGRLEHCANPQAVAGRES